MLKCWAIKEDHIDLKNLTLIKLYFIINLLGKLEKYGIFFNDLTSGLYQDITNGWISEIQKPLKWYML